MKNYPIVLLSTVISPLSLLLVITFVTNGNLFGTAIEGGLIMVFFSSGIALQSDLSHLKNDFKLQDMIVSSPTSSRLYMVGMALAEIVYSIPALAILVVLAGIYLHPSLIQIAILSIVLLLMFAVSVAIGFMLSTFSSDVVQSYAFSRLLSLLFCYFAASILSDNICSCAIQLPCLSFADNLCGGNYAFSNRLPQHSS